MNLPKFAHLKLRIVYIQTEHESFYNIHTRGQNVIIARLWQNLLYQQLMGVIKFANFTANFRGCKI